jgi:hypothetical protein
MTTTNDVVPVGFSWICPREDTVGERELLLWVMREADVAAVVFEDAAVDSHPVVVTIEDTPLSVHCVVVEIGVFQAEQVGTKRVNRSVAASAPDNQIIGCAS